MDKIFKQIKKIDFKVFLTRPYNLLTLAAHAEAYQERMKKITGFYFKNVGYLSSNNLVEILRVQDELDKLNKKIKSIIVNQPKRFEAILKSGQKFNQLMDEMVRRNKKDELKYRKLNKSQLLREFKQLFDIYASQFVTTTVIPFRSGVILEDLIRKKSLPRYKKYFSIVKKLRMITAYIPFENFALGSLLKEIAGRIGFIDYKILFNLMPYDIENLIKGNFKISERELKKRIQYYAYFRIGQKDTFFWGKNNYAKFKKIFGPKVDKIDIKRGITGNTAYPGKVTGRVKIVLTANDMAKFEKGDILVSINSSPRFMEVIKKCRGIVTDEGGITCHAAVVSREFKIPCIIGTKIATKVLCDGDLIEVDADKGIVRKLK